VQERSVASCDTKLGPTPARSTAPPPQMHVMLPAGVLTGFENLMLTAPVAAALVTKKFTLTTEGATFAGTVKELTGTGAPLLAAVGGPPPLIAMTSPGFRTVVKS